MSLSWPILGTETISIPKHRYSIFLILDTMELQYLLNPVHTVNSCWHAERFLGQMGVFVVRKYRHDCISSKYRQYRTAGMETERIESPGIKYRKQLVSAYFWYLYRPSTTLSDAATRRYHCSVLQFKSVTHCIQEFILHWKILAKMPRNLTGKTLATVYDYYNYWNFLQPYFCVYEHSQKLPSQKKSSRR